MKRLIGLLALLALLGGCAGVGAAGSSAPAPDPDPALASASAQTPPPAENGELDAVLESVQGHWVNLNGGDTLDIEGTKMTLRYGDWSDTYQFRVEARGSYVYLVGTGQYGLGAMSDLEVREDGTLEAYEMVLDGPSNMYKFMREEDITAAMEFQDRSDPDAPKEIKSREIVWFSLVFQLERTRYDLGDQWPSGYYSWEITREDDGSYEMFFSVSGDSYIVTQFREPVDEEYVSGLAELIRQQDLAQFNGYYMTNEVYKRGYSLYVEYASGEDLRISADGDPGDTCVFALSPLLDYAAKQDIHFYK